MVKRKVNASIVKKRANRRARGKMMKKREFAAPRGDKGYVPSNNGLKYNAISKVNRAPTAGFPHEYYAVLPYHEVVSLSLSATPWQVYRFRMNSIFDPNYSGGGGQPRGRDQFHQIYASYHVFAVGFDINFMTKDTTREACLVGAVGCSSYQTLSSVPDYKSLRENNQRYIVQSRIDDQRPVANIKGKWLCRAVEGVDKETYNNDSGPFQALADYNPNACPTLAVFAGTIDQSTMTSAVSVDVKLLYYVKFFTRTVIGPS